MPSKRVLNPTVTRPPPDMGIPVRIERILEYLPHARGIEYLVPMRGGLPEGVLGDKIIITIVYQIDGKVSGKAAAHGGNGDLPIDHRVMRLFIAE